jgi:endonuclease-3 related protein
VGNLSRVEAALEALGRARLLDAQALAGAEPIELRDTLREAGIKLPARAVSVLKRLARWFAERFQNENQARDETSWPTHRLREELAALNGIGPATADAILLLALGRATYPVDRGTYRILVRHGWIDPTAEYDEVSELLTRHAGASPGELAWLSQALIQVGREFCRIRSPQCERCPLRCLLPEQGPLEPEG